MFVHGKMMTAVIGATALSGMMFVPSSTSFAQPAPHPAAADAISSQISAVATSDAPVAAAPVVATAPAPAVAPTPAPAPAVAPATGRGIVGTSEAPAAPVRTASTEVDSELECLAKVVLHEAGNQSLAGRIAVAEVVMNRLQDPRRRFGSTICGVVLQRGQFFNVHAYHPQRRDARWPAAVQVARQVREDMQEGDHDHVTNGGLFFRNSSGAQFRGRRHTVTIGAHHFYR